MAAFSKFEPTERCPIIKMFKSVRFLWGSSRSSWTSSMSLLRLPRMLENRDDVCFWLCLTKIFSSDPTPNRLTFPEDTDSFPTETRVILFFSPTDSTATRNCVTPSPPDSTSDRVSQNSPVPSRSKNQRRRNILLRADVVVGAVNFPIPGVGDRDARKFLVTHSYLRHKFATTKQHVGLWTKH